MSELCPHIDTYDGGKLLSERVIPGMANALCARGDAMVWGCAETVVESACGKVHARGAVDEEARLLTSIAALTALGSQTRPRTQVYPQGALNTAIEVFDRQETNT